MDDEVPNKCPVCKKVTSNLLLHIRKKESCSAQVDKDQYETWKKRSRKKTKRASQQKYMDSGRHNEAQQRYSEACRKKDNSSWKKLQRKNSARHTERQRVHNLIKEGLKDGENKKRKEKFKEMCECPLRHLIRGETPHDKYLNALHLVLLVPQSAGCLPLMK